MRNPALSTPRSMPAARAKAKSRSTLGAAEYRRFFELSLDLLYLAGFDGYFKVLSPAWEEALGFKGDELIAKPFVDLIHPADREATVAERAELASGAATISFENRYLCADGSYKWLASPVAPEVETQMLYGVAGDVTESKRVEAELRALNTELLAVSGRIWVESELGRGSRFSVVLPAGLDRPEAGQPAADVAASGGA